MIYYIHSYHIYEDLTYYRTAFRNLDKALCQAWLVLINLMLLIKCFCLPNIPNIKESTRLKQLKLMKHCPVRASP